MKNIPYVRLTSAKVKDEVPEFLRNILWYLYDTYCTENKKNKCYASQTFAAFFKKEVFLLKSQENGMVNIYMKLLGKTVSIDSSVCINKKITIKQQLFLCRMEFEDE